MKKLLPRGCFSNQRHNKVPSEWFDSPLLLNTMRQEHRCEINGAEQQTEGTVKSLLYNHNKEGGISDC